ncbi:MAG: type II/IV secretion system ATPase subunit [Candidatus Woesearchaeota archaeon]
MVQKKSVKKTSKKASSQKKSSSAKKSSQKTPAKTSSKKKKSAPKPSSTHKKKSASKTSSSPKKKKTSSTKKNAKAPRTNKKEEVLDTYDYHSKDIPITIEVLRVPSEFVKQYRVQIANISETTERILERIRNVLIDKVNLGIVDITDEQHSEVIEERFTETIQVLIERYFPESDEKTRGFLTTYLIEKSLGLGSLDILMDDHQLEEITVNSSSEPVWVFHKTHGWCKTNVVLDSEEQTKHYATTIARKTGRQLTMMTPLLDAHLQEGDRVNATLTPISTQGHTMTIRKFSRDPWTITKLLTSKTMSAEAAALIWLAMQYELSALITGGTASGKTSTLNVLASFIPPEQRIITIEDTRELLLPKFLHWVPMSTRQPNAEQKGEVSMQDLLVNSLRMRPDRIFVGEIRRQKEAETLFEAIHTGHSVYATFHANNVEEAVDRLTNPPINVPKSMLPAISLVINQFRNRRNGKRRTFQIGEVLKDGTVNVLKQYDNKKDKLVTKNASKTLYDTLKLYTGMSKAGIEKDLKEKTRVLEYLVELRIESVDAVGRVFAEYYTDKEFLLRFVKEKKNLPSLEESS